jgi:hypothetical protein
MSKENPPQFELSAAGWPFPAAECLTADNTLGWPFTFNYDQLKLEFVDMIDTDHVADEKFSVGIRFDEIDFSELEMFDSNEATAPTVAPTNKVITIRHNSDYSADQVEVLESGRQLGLYDMNELNPHHLTDILRWLGHPVRTVDYMFPHDIAEFG